VGGGRVGSPPFLKNGKEVAVSKKWTPVSNNWTGSMMCLSCKYLDNNTLIISARYLRDKENENELHAIKKRGYD
jgi:hypothetical protein